MRTEIFGYANNAEIIFNAIVSNHSRLGINLQDEKNVIQGGYFSVGNPSKGIIYLQQFGSPAVEKREFYMNCSIENNKLPRGRA